MGVHASAANAAHWRASRVRPSEGSQPPNAGVFAEATTSRPDVRDTGPAMAADDEELVRRAFAAYASHDVARLLALLDPEIEIRSLMTEAERTIYRGHQGAREWLQAVLEIFPDWKPRVREVRDVGGGLVVAFDASATGAGSGVPIFQIYWQAVRIRDGRLAYFGFWRTEAEARAAARDER